MLVWACFTSVVITWFRNACTLHYVGDRKSIQSVEVLLQLFPKVNFLVTRPNLENFQKIWLVKQNSKVVVVVVVVVVAVVVVVVVVPIIWNSLPLDVWNSSTIFCFSCQLKTLFLQSSFLASLVPNTSDSAASCQHCTRYKFIYLLTY